MRFAAFLRAINVGGRTVEMSRLREIFTRAGCSRVESLIASGNIAFDSTARDPVALAARLETVLEKALGFEVPVFLRSPPELERVATQLANQAGFDGTIYVVFLAQPPSPNVEQRLHEAETAGDTFQVDGREVYWRLHTAFTESPFSGPVLEKLLGAAATARKSTTVLKMAARLGVGGRV